MRLSNYWPIIAILISILFVGIIYLTVVEPYIIPVIKNYKNKEDRNYEEGRKALQGMNSATHGGRVLYF